MKSLLRGIVLVCFHVTTGLVCRLLLASFFSTLQSLPTKSLFLNLCMCSIRRARSFCLVEVLGFSLGETHSLTKDKNGRFVFYFHGNHLVWRKIDFGIGELCLSLFSIVESKVLGLGWGESECGRVRAVLEVGNERIPKRFGRLPVLATTLEF